MAQQRLRQPDERQRGDLKDFDITHVVHFIKEKMVAILAFLKSHRAKLLLNVVFSIVVGHLWSSDPSDHMEDTIKLFFTIMGAHVFIHFGVEKIHKIKDVISDKFTNLFEPFKNFENKLEDVMDDTPVVENLLTF